MFGRMSFLSGDPGRIDDVIAYAHDTVKPATDRLAGNLGLGAWINRDTGDVLVMTVWQDEASMRASEEAVLQLREDAADMIGGTAAVERYETVLVDMTEPHQLGFVMRMVRMNAEPGALEDHQAWARDQVLPVMRSRPGYISHVAAVDRATGAVAAMTTYRDAASAAAALATTQAVREAATARGLTIRDLRDYQVAIVGIRAPAPAIPAQSRVDVAAEQQHAAR